MVSASFAESRVRGADLLVRALAVAGVERVFTLSGNHVMPVFDALLDARIELIHVRQEAAAVHMADAVGRLTGRPGVALVTGGQGHTNAVAALYPAMAADSPLLLLSGHAPLAEAGLGSFQELAQADLARPTSKASWTAASVATVGHDVARAWSTAVGGRPGPVHLSLPVDLLEGELPDRPGLTPGLADFVPAAMPLAPSTAAAVVAAVARASAPVVVAGPSLARRRADVRRLGECLRAPAVVMESPRGLNDPSLGALAQVLGEADLIVLLGKPLDFTLGFGRAPAIDARCRFVCISGDPAQVAATARALGPRLEEQALAAPDAALDALLAAVDPNVDAAPADWLARAEAALAARPADWPAIAARSASPIHPLQLFAALQRWLDRHPDALLVSDGGEIGQWAQATLHAPTRLINGVAGSIGHSVPFALAARVLDRGRPVLAVLGDGSAGFHLAEFDTAVRANLPFVAVVGNDARWNAEHQIQLKRYGAARAHGCSLLPTRYDQVVAAMGGYGEQVTDPGDLPGALERAFASGRPACVNVMIAGEPAPVIRV